MLNRINNILHIPIKSFINIENTLPKYPVPDKNKIRNFIEIVIELRKTQGELINYTNNINKLEHIDEEQIIETTYAVKDYLKTIHEFRNKIENADVSGHMVGFKERNIRLIVSIDNYFDAYLKNLLNSNERKYREIMSKEAKKINECIKIISTELKLIINDYNES